jgi:ABC-type nitrate/sulfonate/bicarbonate transport system substrate-binding protein
MIAKQQPGTPIRLGFVPLCDCAPIVMAHELGLFEKHGVEVELEREIGWATVRDKILYGELDAAHATAAMAFSTTLGLGSIRVPCVTGLVLNMHGNAITLSNRLWDAGVRDGRTLREFVRSGPAGSALTLGVVFPFSSHNFLLRKWLLSHGIDPERDVQIAVVPPSRMAGNLKAGNLDGYCVGEPWNSVGVMQRAGWVVVTSSQIAPHHPEKILMVPRVFAEEREAEHIALIRALIEACRFCDKAGNREQVIATIARKKYVSASERAVRMSLRGPFDFGKGRVEDIRDFNRFHGASVNEPGSDKAGWVLEQMIESGVLRDRSLIEPDTASKVFRADIFHKAIRVGKSPITLHSPAPRSPGIRSAVCASSLKI